MAASSSPRPRKSSMFPAAAPGRRGVFSPRGKFLFSPAGGEPPPFFSPAGGKMSHPLLKEEFSRGLPFFRRALFLRGGAGVSPGFFLVFLARPKERFFWFETPPSPGEATFISPGRSFIGGRFFLKGGGPLFCVFPPVSPFPPGVYFFCPQIFSLWGPRRDV